VPEDLSTLDEPERYKTLVRGIRAIAAREAEEIEHRYPKVLRRVGGYNLDMMLPAGKEVSEENLGFPLNRYRPRRLPNGSPRLQASGAINMAHLLVGSEGTLAYSRRIHLNLSPLPKHRTLGVCHFASFYRAMEAPQHIVKLKPVAVELVDSTMIQLARDNPAFRPIVQQFIRGTPAAILLVEFAGDDAAEQLARLKQLVELMGDLGFPGSVVEITDAALQRDVWEVRKAGLNIMMSMKGDGKPVSFIEDCAVPLEHLAEYTDRLTRVFEKHGTRGTWYAHASVGCLHVRPVLDMRSDGASKMRAIAEEAAELVRQYKGAYSGEHGDGLVRSEWIAPFFGPKLTRAFEDIKQLFDPKGLLNPGKIVRPPKQDDRTLFRFKPGYATQKISTVLDWSEFEGGLDVHRGHGFAKAIEMCNNNGHCRKFDAGTMCPSYRATQDEQHLTRGRANTLRLAISGQLGPDAFTSQAVYDALELCVSCKGCKRECPTGVDMAKMKVEFLYHYKKRHGLTLKDRVVAYLPRYARWASRLAPVANALSNASRGLIGFTRHRRLPQWRSDDFRASAVVRGRENREVLLFVDTFNRYFEPENAQAALDVLQAAGYTVHFPEPAGVRPLCCGRTFLACGFVDQARQEARRMLDTLLPYVERGIPVVGLEPSCMLGLRDDYLSLLPGAETAELDLNAFLFEEFLMREREAGRLQLDLKPLAYKRALLHGHCHQKAFAVMPAVEGALRLIPELAVDTIVSSCCGMAGSFGYEAARYDVSMKMGELAVFPRVRQAAADTLVVADGTSCRQQIQHGTQREAVHVARVLQAALTGVLDKAAGRP
jgi:Fe-S oxidoreductase